MLVLPGNGHFYIATVQTDKPLLFVLVLHGAFFCAQFEQGKQSFPRRGYFQQCMNLQVLILSQYGRPPHELFSSGKTMLPHTTIHGQAQTAGFISAL